MKVEKLIIGGFDIEKLIDAETARIAVKAKDEKIERLEVENFNLKQVAAGYGRVVFGVRKERVAAVNQAARLKTNVEDLEVVVETLTAKNSKLAVSADMSAGEIGRLTVLVAALEAKSSRSHLNGLIAARDVITPMSDPYMSNAKHYQVAVDSINALIKAVDL
ncbi:MAG: hypothetical protein KAT00_00220 [Planctomycetes bacterium]|nr:hypothetical protein [Planctomycetota bacterium]